MASFNKICKAVIRLHLIRLQRNTRDMNLLVWLILLVAIAMPLMQLWHVLSERGAGSGLTLFFGLGLASLHVSRKDYRLLQALYQPAIYLFWAEYLIFSLPFILILLFLKNGWALGTWFLVLLLVPMLPQRRTKGARQLIWGRLIPAYFFEWISGMRTGGYWMLFFYLLAWLVTPFVPVAAFLLLWLMFAVVSGFYNQCEPLVILQAAEQGAAPFLRKKIIRHLSLGMVLLAPISVWYVVFYPAHWYIVLVFMVLNHLQHLFFILNKYAHYRPNGQLGAGGVLAGLVSLSVIIPFFAPLPLFLCINYWPKAIQHLNRYLYAYH
jgi:hypothetical protein